MSALVFSTFSLTFSSGSGNSPALVAADCGSTTTKHGLVQVRTTGSNGCHVSI